MDLFGYFLRSALQHGDQPALEIENRSLTYRELALLAFRLGNVALTLPDEPGTHRVAAILASRSVAAYGSVLGSLAAGFGYVPLNPKFPTKRNAVMLRRSGARLLFVGTDGLSMLPDLLDGLDVPMTVVGVDIDTFEGMPERCPAHRFVLASNLSAPRTVPPRGPTPHLEDTAYLLFTSGSTGHPKGVPVSHKNISSYLDYSITRYQLTRDDRCSQMFELTFDLSVHDLFVTWASGATLVSVPERILMAPAKFIREQRLTRWFSVPSVVMFMSRMKALKPGAFPDLRWSLFCGEALPAVLAQAWQRAAPESIVENLYGPTEATIAITSYVWSSDVSPGSSPHGIVPIGRPFPGHQALVMNDDGELVAATEEGELCLAGPQVTAGYLNDPTRTARSYRTRCDDTGRETRWYRTGDLVRQEPDGCLVYLGRLDNQVQILGHRVELQEVEHAIRARAKGRDVIAIPWPVRDGRAEALFGFVTGPESVTVRRDALTYCRETLPPHMHPRDIVFLDRFPLNSNGKVDRTALVTLLEERTR